MRTFAIACVAGLAGSASGDIFQITIENLSNNALSPTGFITQNLNFDAFDEGAALSGEMEMLAEEGDFSGVQALALASPDVLDVQQAMGGPIMPGESRTISIEATEDFRYLSFMSMLGISNDGFIGTTAGEGLLDLFHNGQPLFADFTVSWLDVWDGGTEVNDELAENVPGLGGVGGVEEGGVLSIPHGGILGVGDIPLENDWYGFDVARITIVPAPGAVALMGLGGLVMTRRRR